MIKAEFVCNYCGHEFSEYIYSSDYDSKCPICGDTRLKQKHETKIDTYKLNEEYLERMKKKRP